MSTNTLKIRWHVEKKSVDELINFKKNYRKINEKNALELKKSITKFGVAAIPAINTDNTILAGHQRVAQMKLLGIKETDVLVPDRALTDEEMLRFNVLANSVSGQWDFGILANGNTIDELLEWGFSSVELGLEPPTLETFATETVESLKQISLVYPNDTFDELVLKLNEIRTQEEFREASFSDIIIGMLNHDYYNL